MKKKILSLLYILILNSNAYSASEPQLPPPLPLSEEIVNPSNKEDSFWNKALNFFGFGNKKQEDKKVAVQENQAEKNANDLGYKNNNTAEVNSESPAKNFTAITKETSISPSAPNSDNALINNKNQPTDKNSLQKIPDIADLKLPDGVKPDEELPAKPKVAASNNSASNSQLLTEKEAKNNISDLKLPDGIKPDEELPSKTKAVVSDNTAPNSQLLTEKEAKNNISDLKLPDGIKPDEELPSKTKAVVSDNTAPNSQLLTEKEAKNNISDLKLPDGIKPDKELPSKPKAVVSDNTAPNSQLLTEKEAKNNISDLKLPDGIKPDEELPSKPKAVINDNTSPNSQLLTEKEAKNNISDLKLPDEIKPDEELPSKPKAVISDNTSPNSQLLTEKEAKNNISDLKLPDGIKPDEELPSKPKAVVSDVVSLNTSDASNKDPQNTSEQNIALSLPTNDNKSATNNKALAGDNNAIPNTSAENANSKNNTPLSTTGNLSEPKTDKVPPENIKLTQNPAGQSSQNTEASNVKTYRQHFQDRLNKTQQLPEISKDDLNPVAAPEAANPAQIKFVNDEAQVLILPNDEVVLGELTRESQLDLMDLNSYLKIFWDNYYSIKNEPARKVINNFIKNYDANFNKQDTTIKNENIDALSEAFKAIDRNNIYDFINLLDSYPIIQLVDCDGNTLLHKAVYKNNYPVAKFLIMKGIDLSTKNNQGVTALEIAVSQNNHEIETLLRSAGAK